MPTYEYLCKKCGKTFETFQSMRDKPLLECPKALCRARTWSHGKVKRLFGTGAGLIFKGSGFYVTDYRSKAYQDAAKKDAPAGATSTTTAEKPSGSKESGSAPPAAAPSKTSDTKRKKETTE